MPPSYSAQQKHAEEYVREHQLDRLLDGMLNTLLIDKPDYPKSALIDMIWEKVHPAEREKLGALWAVQKLKKSVMDKPQSISGAGFVRESEGSLAAAGAAGSGDEAGKE